MATAYQNLSSYDFNSVPDASAMRIGIMVSEWNGDVTEKLLEGACNTLEKHGVKPGNIYVERVPGSFELNFGARMMAEHLQIDAVIVLGCIVKGDTPHFDYVCEAVTQGLTELNLRYNIPFIFGILTTNNLKQAEERCGGIYGNKGDETAIAAIKMIDYACRIKK
ncbi:MAG: 6,7-dimethyl-8-ribityllumazine synthase [Tannerella sp.]|jgi:6,7-dimethyl-8-ribityllumazine synthase|nr:6,7-dimethyl-8-ribityllumazine synthase [Tannerella sp.]